MRSRRSTRAAAMCWSTSFGRAGLEDSRRRPRRCSPGRRFPSASAISVLLEFSKLLIEEADVAVSPGLGFGEYGEGYVRIALVENEHRIRQAARNIKKFLARSARILLSRRPAPRNPQANNRPHGTPDASVSPDSARWAPAC